MGWIKLDRQLLDNALWFAEPFTRGQAWVDLLLLASHNDEAFLNKKGVLTKLKRGQLVTSIPKLEKRWKWSRGKVERYLRLLVDMEMIHKVGTANGTTLTIVNYSKFQNRRYANEPTDERANERADGRTDERLSRSKRIKEDKNALPSSPYWKERKEFDQWLDEWAEEGDKNEQNES